MRVKNVIFFIVLFRLSKLNCKTQSLVLREKHFNKSYEKKNSTLTANFRKVSALAKAKLRKNNVVLKSCDA